MREILFRGKRADGGGWVEGDLLTYGQYRSIRAVTIKDGLPYYFGVVIVIPSTVGQFSGLHDRDGKRIFEGDLIALNEMIVPVTWEDGAFHMISDKNSGKSPLIQDRVKRFKITGNIHEEVTP